MRSGYRKRLLRVVLASCGLLAFTAPALGATVFTVAGRGGLVPLGEGGPAMSAGIETANGLAVTADGGFLVIDGPRIREVAPDGRIATVAGASSYGYDGDGGPARAAKLDASSLAVQPDGGFLVAECLNNRVRRVAPDGRITTVAGVGPRTKYGGGKFAGDGGPAIAAHLACPVDAAVTSDGGFVIADSGNYRVRRVGSDGLITTIAGRGGLANDRYPRATGDGGPAIKATLGADAVAVMPDGSLLVADALNNDVRRVWPDGHITTAAGRGGYDGPLPRDGTPATIANVTPRELAVAPNGDWLIADTAVSSCGGEEPRVLRVSDGRVYTVAGSGRFIDIPPRGDENRGDGGPATAAELRSVYDVAFAPDGGVLFAEGEPTCSQRRFAGLVRYVPPASPRMLAAAFVRPQARFFDPGIAPSLSVALSLAARVTLNVPAAGDAATITATLPAGRTHLRLRVPLARKPQNVELTAVDDAGRVAADRLEIYPNGWLTLARAQIDLLGAIYGVPKFEAGYSGSGILGCRRLAPGRIDCRLTANGGPCDAIATIMLRRSLILWGAYKCRGGYREQPRWTRKPRVLRRSNFACDESDDWCAKHPLARAFAWGTDDEYASLGL